jgi:hypothetical protein
MIRLAMMRGDAKFVRLAITDVNDEPVDLAELDDIEFTAKACWGDTVDTATTIHKSLGEGIAIVDDPTDGVLDVAIDAEDTEGLTHGRRMVWDVQATQGVLVQTVARGYLWVYADVTT